MSPRGRVFGWVVGALLSHCAPLTYSNEAVVDFSSYQTVLIEACGPDGAARHVQYLATQLRESSGFEGVSTNDGATADLLLRVCIAIETESDFFGDDERQYSAILEVTLTDEAGRLVDEVEVEGAEYSSPIEAAESSLDQLVTRYLPSYRI